MTRTLLALVSLAGLFVLAGMISAGGSTGCPIKAMCSAGQSAGSSSESPCCADKDACPVAGAGDGSGPGCCGGGHEASAATATTVSASKEKDKKGPEPKCPVMGGKIDKTVSAEHRGGKVYFCCAGCIEKFTKDKAKYEAKANAQLVLTGQARQKGCPLSGGKVDPAVKLEVDGVPVGFCCEGCQGKVKKASADKQRDMVFGEEGFEKAFALKEKK